MAHVVYNKSQHEVPHLSPIGTVKKNEIFFLKPPFFGQEKKPCARAFRSDQLRVRPEVTERTLCGTSILLLIYLWGALISPPWSLFRLCCRAMATFTCVTPETAAHLEAAVKNSNAMATGHV